MKAILVREFKAYFTSPIGYVFLAFYLLFFGFYCVGININQSTGNYDTVINSLTMLLLFTVPLLTMRLLAEERKNRTDQLLLTAPVSIAGIVLGKYLAAIFLLLLTLVLTLIHPIVLTFLGDVPWSTVISTYIGYFLLGCSLSSVSLFVSALTENQIVAAIGSIGAFLALLFADTLASLIPGTCMASFIFIIILICLVTLFIYFSIKNIYISGLIGIIFCIAASITYKINSSLFEGLTAKILKWFSLFSRYDNFSLGLLDVGAIFYFISFIFVFLFLTHQTISKRRWN